MTESVTVCRYRPELASDFARLNYEWIERYFEIEPEDRRSLENPQGYVLDGGGEIFFVLENDEPVGCVAMIWLKDEPGVIELAKMAVRPDRQGRGYSDLLMRACIDFAQAAGASMVMLQTNDVLKPALGLYEKYGFVALAEAPDERYARSNLEMRRTIAPAAT